MDCPVCDASGSHVRKQDGGHYHCTECDRYYEYDESTDTASMLAVEDDAE